MPAFNPSLESIQDALPQFREFHQVGAGGQKVVYRALNEAGAVRAVKLFPIEPGCDDQRARREIETSTVLRGSCFADHHSVLDRVIERTPCVVVEEEFIVGSTLRERLASGAQSLPFVRHVLDRLLAAMEETERCRIVHRDIKPENVIVEPAGRVVLIDFGIARHLDALSLTATGMNGPLTPCYASPEQIRNEKRSIGTRTDLYAIGLLGYELVNGVNPFIVGPSSELFHRILNRNLPPLVTPARGLADFVSSLMTRIPHRRPQTVDAAKQLFNRIQWGD